jgi:hypothetical protein
MPTVTTKEEMMPQPQIELDPATATYTDVCNAINVLSARQAGLEAALMMRHRLQTPDERTAYQRYEEERHRVRREDGIAPATSEHVPQEDTT